MLSILVCHSYFLRFDQKQQLRAKPYPPLASLHVAAMLRAAGHEVSFFDAMLADDLNFYERRLSVIKPQVVLFYEDNFNFLSKMCLGKMRDACFEMIAAARAAGMRIIAAGSDASDAPGDYLAAGADIVLHGEALGALSALVCRLNGAPDLPNAELAAGLPDVSHATPAGPKRSVAAAPLPEPSLAALPAWDLIDIEKVPARLAACARDISVSTWRHHAACPFRCNWCAKPIWGNQYLQRPAAAVAAEMLHLKRHYRPDHIWFADDIFGFKADWVREFAAALASSGGGVPFTIQLRADLVSKRMAAALYDAGCREVWIGAESGSQKILDAMNKGTTVSENIAARHILRDEGIRVGFFLQLGYLGENLDDILATRRLVDEARPDDVGVSVAYPLPGTKFYELVKEQMGDKRHWQESSDLEMMFHGTYTSDFYRAVRNLLHDQVTHPGTPGTHGTLERSHRTRGRVPPRPRATAIAPAADDCAGFRLSRNVRHPPHARLLPRRGREGAADHEAVSAARPALSLRVSQERRILGRGVRQHVRGVRRAREAFAATPAAWSASTPTS
jgi:anaerobic magnesium-protoporphyrin IX monomethyl ester cyclase